VSSTYHSQIAALERKLTGLVCEAMGCDFETAAVSVAGRRATIQGIAPSYAAKERAAEVLREAGYGEIENRLRVAPGMAIS
jgi:hypothetical protein